MLHQPSLPSRWRFCSNKRTHNDTLLPRAPLASSRAIMWSVERNFPDRIWTLEGARLKRKSRKLKKIKENNWKNTDSSKLKKIAEMVTSIFIKNNHGKTSGKSFALIEFDSVKFETIFLESTKFKEKIFLYNHHRPIIYNRKSFKILKFIFNNE